MGKQVFVNILGWTLFFFVLITACSFAEQIGRKGCIFFVFFESLVMLSLQIWNLLLAEKANY